MDTGKEVCQMDVKEFGQLVGLACPSLSKTLAGNSLTILL